MRRSSHVIERGDLGRPARLHHRGGVGLADQRRPGDAVAREQIGAIEHRRGAIRVAGEDLDRVHRSRRAAGASGQRRLLHRIAGRVRLDGHRLDDQLPVRGREAEARAMRRGEVGDDLRASLRSGTINAASVPA